ncbi:YtpR family tRNA-binding protein [Streptococcus ferus]|uniref:Phenylalanyl-tRNA synthetase subunit beta n=1 Tax=Streptococcus ferus TaxID=1345 RepID=A0A2X3XY94_9STRE|nr:DUF4479 and tRNA-binding domain-containing protein [Streptococcus ferus]SQF39412.1 phenylalanyl-tRNA synthetase subunit beta [Streptococcus ferus]
MIFTYNQKSVGDVLMVILADHQGQKLAAERKGRVTRIYRLDNQQTVAWNIFDASQIADLSGSGQIELSEDSLARFNTELGKEGFTEILEKDAEPKFVVGEITAMAPHADSDHLNICQVRVTDERTLQIVAGAPNAKVGLKTIVALPGAMMPNGSLIFAGQLRGVDSFGMMCSPRELALPNAPQKRGIIELPSTALVGAPFDANKHWSA